jgi:electron transfer flavoprotein beta subunit
MKLAASVKQNPGPDLIIVIQNRPKEHGRVAGAASRIARLPSVSSLKKVEMVGGALTVQHQTESGYDRVEVPLPAVITETAGSVAPGHPVFKGIMAAQKRPMKSWPPPTSGWIPPR